jgi:hypothetical protein
VWIIEFEASMTVHYFVRSIAPISIHIHRLVHRESFSLLGKRPPMCG